MSLVLSFLNHRLTFWALLCLPAVPMLGALALSDDPRAVRALLHPTGEFAARFMILAMMITPLTQLLKGWRGPIWLKARRRWLGVAAFGYAAAHTALYLADVGAAGALAEATRLSIWTGWAAFAIFAPLAATSTDGWVRRLGPRWKSLQRWVYGAAVLTLLHWAALHDWGGVGPALVHFAPLAVLSAFRLARLRRGPRARAA